MAAPPEVTINDLSGKFVMNHKLSDDIEPILTLQGLSWFLRKAIGIATITLSIREYTTTTNTQAFLASSTSTSSTSDQTAKPATETTGDANSVKATHIDITQVATGGISTTQENRVLDWGEREHKDRIFGTCVGRSRFFSSSPSGDEQGFEMVGSGKAGAQKDVLDEKFLQAQVLQDGIVESSWFEEDGKEGSRKHVQSWVLNVDQAASGGWTAEQTWGFEKLLEEASDGKAKRYYTRRVVVRKEGEGKDAKVERARLVYDYIGKLDDDEVQDTLDAEY